MASKIAVVNTFGIVGNGEGRGRIVGFASTVDEALAMSHDPAFKASLPAFEQSGLFLVSAVPGNAEIGEVHRIRRPALATVREHGRTLAVYQQPYTFALVEWIDGDGRAIGYREKSEILLAFKSIGEALDCARGMFLGESRGSVPLSSIEGGPAMVAP